MTEVWFRNPHNYVRQLAELGGPYKIVWDRGMLVKKKIDPVMHAKLYFGTDADFEILCVGEQGSAHLDSDHTMRNPKAVYPTWAHGDDVKILEEMVSSPIGADIEACDRTDLPPDELPVLGQDHRVVITNLPNAHLAANRPFFRMLRELQEEYPECNMTLHGLYSFRVMFGMGFGSADIDPRTDAAKGKVILPNGKYIAYARAVGQLQWVNLMGMRVTDLKEPVNRCLFNIKSARWAGEHFNEDIKFKTRGTVEVDPESPLTVVPTTASSRVVSTLQMEDGDMMVCDSCSLSDACKYYREGAVCSMPKSDSKPLVDAFKSRNSDKIIDALGTVMGARVERLHRGMESEEEFGELDPEVTKMMSSLFNDGIKLAKLVDPTLAKPLVQINNGVGGNPSLQGASPQEVSASIIRALEAQGIERANITPEMFEGMLRKMTGGDRVLD